MPVNLKFAKALYKIASLADKYSFLARIMAVLKSMPLIWKVIELTPLRDDHVFALPQDKVVQVNQSLNAPEETVLPSQILEYFIKKSKYRFLMNFCFCRYSNECKDYPIGYGCLFIGETASKIPSNRGRLVSIEEALNYAKKCRDLGLVQLIGKAAADPIILGVSPHDKFLTVCFCCPCCCGLGLFKHVPHQLARTYEKMPGIEIKITEACVGCGTCAKNTCFIDAIRVVNKRVVINDDCKACGRCVLACPNNAIELMINDDLYIDKGIKEIERRVDVI